MTRAALQNAAKGSTADQESARRGEHLRPGFVERTFAKQSRRRAVIELRVQTLEPRLRDLSAIGLSEKQRRAVAAMASGSRARCMRDTRLPEAVMERCRIVLAELAAADEGSAPVAVGV